MAKGEMTIVLNKAEYQRLVNTLNKAADVDTTPAVQRGLREGANTLKNAGKTSLATRNKEKTGNLRRSFTIKVTRRKKIGTNYAMSGFKRSTKNNKNGGGNHAHLIDRGTDKRYTLKGAYRGSISKGSPNVGSSFWTDTVETEGPRAMNRLVNVIESELRKLMG